MITGPGHDSAGDYGFGCGSVDICSWLDSGRKDGELRTKTASGHYIVTVFPDQRKLTENYAKIIRKVYGSNTLTARSKQKAVMTLPGINREEMESILKTTGPELALCIRKIISPHRAKTRTKTRTKKRH